MTPPERLALDVVGLGSGSRHGFHVLTTPHYDVSRKVREELALVNDTTLYFSYTALMSPYRIRDVAPGAEFAFIAHLPETRLIFPYELEAGAGALPSVRPEPGNTVWGAMFSVSDQDLEAITAAESVEYRSITYDFKAVDREGKRHSVVTHVHADLDDRVAHPAKKYMGTIVLGARHWKLPTGWIAGLEEHMEDPLI